MACAATRFWTGDAHIPVAAGILRVARRVRCRARGRDPFLMEVAAALERSNCAVQCG